MVTRKIGLAVVMAIVATLATLPAYATHNTPAVVSATVTPGLVSVTLDTSLIAYGTLNLGLANQEPIDTSDAANNQTQVCSTTTEPITATNSGNVNGDISIRGADSTGAVWTLVSTGPGTDEYIHRVSTNPTTCTFTALTTSNLQIGASIAGAGTQDFYLNLDLPTDVTTSTTEASLPITVSIAAS